MPWSKADLYPPLEQAETPAAMRTAIEKQRLYIPIVRQVLDVGRYRGLSAEDVYSMLAYHALQQLSETMRTALKLAQIAPPVPVLVDIAQLPPGFFRSSKGQE